MFLEMALISNAHPSPVDQTAVTSLPVDFVSLLQQKSTPHCSLTF